MTQNRWDVVIVGGGAAGLSAALVLARARRRVLVVDGGAPRNRFAAHMHGILGRDGYSPWQLLADGRREIAGYGGAIETGRIVRARRVADGFEVTTGDGITRHGRRLLVATGLRDELPEIDGLAGQWGAGVVQCPYCDGYEVRDKRIGVIATGPASLHQVHLVRQWSQHVTFFVQLTGVPDGEDLVGLRARGIRIEQRGIRRVTTVDDAVSGIELADGTAVGLDAVFVMPRFVAQDELLDRLGADRSDTPAGPWVTSDPSGRTSVEGLWVAGNTANPMALVPMAAGSGTAAAVAINADLVRDDVAQAIANDRSSVPAA